MLADRVMMGSGESEIILAPGNIVGYENNLQVSHSYGTYRKVKSVIVNAEGVVRVTFNLLNYGISGTARAEIRVNDEMVDYLLQTSDTYISKSIDIDIQKGDEISLYLGGTANGPKHRNNLFSISLNKAVPEDTFMEV